LGRFQTGSYGWKADVFQTLVVNLTPLLNNFGRGETELASPDIFLSYNREDAARAKLFADAFAAEGFDVWWDANLKSGEAYDKVTEDALHGARAVVVLWSPRSVDSRWVRAEATVADQNGTLVPAMIEACRRPVMFELTQTAELAHWQGDRTDPAWQAFVGHVRDMLGNEARAAPAETPGAATETEAKPDRRILLIGGIVAIAAIVVVAFFFWKPGEQPARTALPIEIEAFEAQGGPQASAFAETMRNTVQGVLGDAGYQTRLLDKGVEAKSGGNSKLTLKGSLIASEERLRLYVVIEDLASGVALWSRQFEDARSAADRLAIAASVASAETLYAIRDAEKQKGFKLDPDTLGMFIEGEHLTANPQMFEEGRPRQIFEQITTRLPNFATGHAMLALALINETFVTTASEHADLIERSRTEAEEAIKIDPAASGAAYDALSRAIALEQPGKLIPIEDILLEGIEKAPGFGFLNVRECDLLANVGRIDEAQAYCQRGLAERPLAGPINWRYAATLAQAGSSGLAEKAIDRATRYYPDSANIRIARFEILAFGDTPERAEAMLPAMLNQRRDYGPEEIAAMGTFIRARVSGSAGDRDAAVLSMRSAVSQGNLDLGFALGALAMLGRVDDAFDLASQSVTSDFILMASRSMFQPFTASLRADPRFWPLAARLGLADYWMTRDKWPDFCGKEIPLETCKNSAAEAKASIT